MSVTVLRHLTNDDWTHTASGDALNPPHRRHQGLAGWWARAHELAERTGVRQAIVRVWHRLHTPHLSARVVASSVAIGLAIGLLPVYGLHGALVLLVCVPLRLDAVLAFAATMISNPVTFPLLILLELELGEELLGKSSSTVQQLMTGEGWLLAGKQILVGSGILAVAVGGLGWGIAWGLVRYWQSRAHRAAKP